MTSLRQYSRDQGGRFSSVNSLTNRAQELHEEHPVATTAGAAGAAVLGAKTGSYVKGARVLRNLDPDKAGQLAQSLNQGGNYRNSLIDDIGEMSKPLDALKLFDPTRPLRQRGSAYKKVKGDVPEDLHGALGQMKRGSDLWADTFGGVKDSRRVASEKIGPIDFLNFNHRPKHRIMQRVVENSPENSETLYRGMGMKGAPKVGDELDLDMTSWTSDPGIADLFSATQSKKAGSALGGRTNRSQGGGQVPVIFRMDPGKGRSAKISNLTRTAQKEHVTPKGRYRVVSNDGEIVVERIGKSHNGDPFGLAEMVAKNLTQAQIDRKKKIQSATSKTTGALGLGALGAQAAGSLVSRGKLKKLPTVSGGKLGVRDVKPKKDSKKILAARTPLLTASAGVGSLGAFNFASYTKAEAQQRKKK